MAKREEEARSTDRSEEEAKRKPLANRESPRSQDKGRSGNQGREAAPVTTGCALCKMPGTGMFDRRVGLCSGSGVELINSHKGNR